MWWFLVFRILLVFFLNVMVFWGKLIVVGDLKVIWKKMFWLLVMFFWIFLLLFVKVVSFGFVKLFLMVVFVMGLWINMLLCWDLWIFVFWNLELILNFLVVGMFIIFCVSVVFNFLNIGLLSLVGIFWMMYVIVLLMLFCLFLRLVINCFILVVIFGFGYWIVVLLIVLWVIFCSSLRNLGLWDVVGYLGVGGRWWMFLIDEI